MKQQSTIDPCKLLNLAYTIILLSLLYFFCITFIPIPESGQDNAKYISGFLIGTGLASIIAYYFRKSGNPDPVINSPTDFLSDKAAEEKKS